MLYRGFMKSFQTIKSKLKVGSESYFAFDLEKNINDRNYYVYTINKYSDYSNGYCTYCIDMNIGNLFSWYGNKLLPID